MDIASTSIEDHPTSRLEAKTFGQASDVGLKLARSESLFNVPAVSVDFDSGTVEVQCRGFQV
jgi:hypothetical protein